MRRSNLYMRYALGLALVFFTAWAVQAMGQEHIPLGKGAMVYPQVPRVSAHEAYWRYKAGKAIILHAGGEEFRKKHISGAFNLEQVLEDLHAGKDNFKIRFLRKLPKTGMEIFIYCY